MKNLDEYTIHCISNNIALKVCKFVVRVNYQMHKQYATYETISNDMRKAYQEEINLFDESHYYLIVNNINEIVGTIRAGLWNKSEQLPIQKEFKIPPAYTNHAGQIWHIGRFAIDPERIGKNRVKIFKTLLFHAIQHVCRLNDSIMLAECDRKLQDKVKLLGIFSSEIGLSKQYIGSETVPIFNTSQGLKSFLCKHKHLQCLSVTESTSANMNRLESDRQKYYSPEQDWVA